jgi:hypothetical protein
MGGMNSNFIAGFAAGPPVKDEAGPLWLMLEDFLESLPVRPKSILLAGLVALVIAATVAFVIASYKRRK